MAHDRIVIRDDALAVVASDGRGFTVLWSDVAQVFFYKLATTKGAETVWITFDLHDGRYWEIHDGMEGFEELVRSLGTHLPLSRTDWAAALSEAKDEDDPVTIFGSQPYPAQRMRSPDNRCGP